MKRIILSIFIMILLLFSFAHAQIYLTASDGITISGRTLDSSGFYITPDSVRIIIYRDGIEEHDAWYNSSDAQCSAVNDMLVFTDAFGDIDDNAGDGLYEVMAGFFKDDGDLYCWKTIWVYLGVDMGELMAINDSIEAWDDDIAKISEILDSLRNQDNWVGNIRYDYSDSVLELAGIKVIATATDSDAVVFIGDGGGRGLEITGGNTGSGMFVTSGSGASSAYGIYAGAYGNGSVGFQSSGLSGNSHGFRATRYGTGNDFYLSGDGKIRGSIDSIGSGGIDAIWNEDTTGHYTPPHMGYMASQTGASGADTTAIKTMIENNPGLVIIEDTLADGEEVAIMPDDWTQADSNAYQGSASGLDSNKVAQVFNSFGWSSDSSLHLTYLEIKDSTDSAIVLVTNIGGGDAIQVNALGSGDGIDINAVGGDDIEGNIAGTIDSVNYLKDGISCCSGAGAKSFTIYIADTTGGDTVFLSGVVVSVYSISCDLQASMKTDSYGKAVYATDLDSLLLIANKFNYYCNPDTIVVAETGYTDTGFVYRGSIPTSGSPDLCRLYGHIYDISGNPDGNAVITAWLPAGVSRLDSSIISPFHVETITDSSGYFYLDLIPNDNLIPDTTKYEITIIRTDGTLLRERVTVPDEENWLLTW